MALRRFLFQNVAVGSGYFDSSQDSDDLNLNSLSIKMASGTGTAVDLNTNDVANVRKLTLVTGSGGVTLDGGGQRATNFATPTQASDLVTKSYADAIQSGIDWKGSVRVASTVNVTVASPGAAIDSVTLSVNDRVLLKNQTTGSENGIYTFQGAATPMTRATDAGAGQLTSGAATFVMEGTTNSDSGWVLTTNDPITVGTTSLTFTQFTALGQVTAGNGLTKSGSTISILLLGTAGTAGQGGGLALSASGLALSLATTNPALSVAGGLTVVAGLGISLSAPTANAVNVQLTATGTIGVGTGAAPAIILATTSALSGTGTTTAAGGLAVVAGNGISLSTPTANAVNVALIATTSVSVGTGATPTVIVDSTSAGGTGSGVAAGGLQITANGVSIKAADSTINATGASGLKVMGVPATFTIAGSAVSANVTATNLNTLTGGSDASALHTHTGLTAAATVTPITAGAGGLSKGDPVYMSAAMTVQANGPTCLKGDPSNTTKSILIGLASAAITAAAVGSAQRDGVITGVGSSWTFGQQIFMSNTGGLTNDPTSITSRYRTIQLGFALNATDLLVDIRDYGVRP